MNQGKTIFFAGVCVLLAQHTLYGQCPAGSTVQVTNNSGINVNGSIAWAVNCLNTVPSLTTLTFNIPGSTEIQLNVLLVVNKSGALIDGNSQPGIILDGSSPAGAPANALVLASPNITVQGLLIRNFTSPSGGNAVLANSNNPTIQGNTLISNRTGVVTASPVSAFNITNNTIGAAGMGNISEGISIQGSPSAGVISFNQIAHNGESGIDIIGGTVRIRENSIFCNSGAGITRPSPPAMPTITQANTQEIRGTAPANALVEVFVHSTAGCAGAPCQGKTFVGSASASTTGIWSLPTPGTVSAGEMVTATSTISASNTSAFSSCATVVDCSTFIAGTNHTDVSCFGGANGTAMALPTGSTLSYLWNTGEITQNITNLVAGSYTVTVTNAATGCTSSATAIIGEPAPLVTSATATDVSCNGGNNGTATATATGGTAPFTFVWSTGMTGPTISNLSADTYTVTATDANACTDVATVTVGEPAPLVASATATNVSCNGGNNGTATATATGGTAPFTFVWSTGMTGPTISNLSADTYTVTATDANACTDVATVTVGEPAPLVASATATDVSCNGGNNGTATATATGGTAPFTFVWSTGMTGPTISNLSADTYTVTATDANACTDVATVTVGEPAPLVTSATATDVSCNGGNNGTATATATGGTSPFTFVWSTGMTGPTISNLSADTYTVTATDANACTDVAAITVFEPAPLVTSATATDVSCNGGNNGTATATATGGTSPFTFVWSTGMTGPTISNLSADTYTVTATDANACTDVATVTVGEPAPLVTSTTATDVSCNGGNNGTATATATGGTSPFTFVWSTGSTGSTISNLSADTYTVTATDANACTDVATVTVGEPAPLVTSATATNVSCNGGNNGTATATATGGTAPFTFVWSTGMTGPTISNLSADTYTVTATDANACTDVAAITVFEPAPLVASATATDVSCNGGNNGTATATATGGTSPFTFVWSTGMTGPTISNLSADTYTVTATDANACTDVAAITVFEPAPLVTSATATDVSCNGGNNGTATATATGGTSPFTFVWSTGSTGFTISNLSADTYTVTATDANACTDVAAITVFEPAPLVASATATDVSCNGGNNGTATATATGGTAPFTFVWSTGMTGPTISNLSADTYTVTATDANACTDVATVTVGEPAPLVASATATNVSCNGGNNGTATATATGGTSPFTFVWSTGSTGSTISNLSADTYTVTATDANACTDVATVTVGEPAPLVTSATATNVSCNGGNNGTATATATGGTAPFTFVWSTGMTGPTISNLSADTYTVTATDANACTDVAAITVFEPAPLVASATATDVSCNGGNNGTATATATGGTSPFTFVWSTGMTGPTISNLSADTYTVTATDANACTDVATVTVGEPAPLVTSATATDVSCNGGNNGTATATATGGTSPFTFVWSTGMTGPTISNLSADTYTVTATDANACTDVAAITVFEPAPLVTSATATDVSCNGGNNGTATATATGGTAPFTFVWSTGMTGPTISNLSADTYTVTATDANACTDVATVTVGEPAPLVTSATATNVSCNGGNNGTATATATGGTSPFTFVWSTGMTGPTISNLSADTYTVTATDANACTDVATVTVGEPAPLVTSTTATDVSCNGGNNGTATATATGGTSPFTFVWSTGMTGPTISNLSADTYTVTATDANACTDVATVTVGEPAPLTVSASATDETANNANDGTAQATPGGGTPGYLYVWSNGGNTPLITNLTPGTYTVTVHDANNCSVTATVVVHAFACAGLNAGLSATNVSCHGLSDGTATANPAGGTSPYTFLWSTGTTTSTITNLSTGTYTVVITDALNCTTLGGVTIFQPSELTISISTTNATAGSSNGTATVTATGGTPNYQYTWSNGGITTQISGLAPGNYTVTVQDANGCSMADTAVVGETGTSGPCVSLPAYALYAPAQVCGNTPFNLTVDDLYPAPVVQYRWILPTGDTLVSTDQSISVIATSTAYSGQYYVMRDSAGCRSVPVGGAILTVLSLPPGAAFAGNDTMACTVGVAVLRAAPLAQGTGKWVSLGGATVDNPDSNPSSARNLQPGPNAFVWQVSLGACDQAAADTFVYFLETPPKLTDDMYFIERAQDVAVMEILLNDVLVGIQDTAITLLDAPASGTLEYLPENHRFRYTAAEDFRGTVQFHYVVCNPGSVCGFDCDTALVVIRVLNLPIVPEALIVDDIGPNGQLRIRGINGFSRVEINIANRWGDLVFQEKAYSNNTPWRGDYNRSGKPLPGGAYYYFLNAYDGDQQVGNTQTGVIHLFDGER